MSDEYVWADVTDDSGRTVVLAKVAAYIGSEGQQALADLVDAALRSSAARDAAEAAAEQERVLGRMRRLRGETG